MMFRPNVKASLESMLEGELGNHLQKSKSSDDPKGRNVKTRKTVRSLQSGEFELKGTRDLNGTFEPKESNGIAMVLLNRKLLLNAN